MSLFFWDFFDSGIPLPFIILLDQVLIGIGFGMTSVATGNATISSGNLSISNTRCVHAHFLTNNLNGPPK
jgi:hypothetical protein